MRFVGKNSFLLTVALLATALLANNIDKPFIGHHDWNGAFWGSVVDRYLNYFFYGNRQDLSFASLIFTHYTPFMPILFTISAAIFGLSELSLRLVSVFFSVLLVIFTYKIGVKLFGKIEGFIAALFLQVTPMFLYFGKLPDHEPIVTSLIAGTFFFYIRSEGKKTGYYFSYVLFLFLALLESWPAYFLIVPLTFISIFVRKERFKRAVFPLFLGVVVIILHSFLILVSKGFSGVVEFFHSGMGRSSTSGLFFGATEYSSFSFIATEARYAAIYFTRILLLLSSLFVFRFVYRFLTRKVEKREIYLVALLVYPLLFISTFRSLAFIHDYKLYHFLPFISLSAAVIFYYVLVKLKKFLEDAKLRGLTIDLSLGFIIVSIVLLVHLERLPYLNTLQATSFNTPGYELGTLIKKNTESEDYVLVNSREFKEFYEVFVGYYSGRRVEYDNLSVEDYSEGEELFGKYKYLIFIKGRPFDKELFDLLKKNNTSTIYGAYTFFAE